MVNHPNGLRIHYHQILIQLPNEIENNFINDGGNLMTKSVSTPVLISFYKNYMRIGRQRIMTDQLNPDFIIPQ